jgi:hypothetical protein
MKKAPTMRLGLKALKGSGEEVVTPDIKILTFANRPCPPNKMLQMFGIVFPCNGFSIIFVAVAWFAPP